MEVMATHGYEATPVAEIARVAGLNRGLIHYHFRNKLEILHSAAAQLIDQHHIELLHALSEVEGNPWIQLDTFIDFHLAAGEGADPQALACWLVISAETLRHPRLRAEYEDAFEATSVLLQTIIGRGIDQDLFACEDPAAAAAAIIAAVQGYFVLAATARAAIPGGTAASAVKAMARGLLRAL